MSVYSLALGVDFSAVACTTCGIVFAVDDRTRREWARIGRPFYCPNMHSNHYGETDAQRLKKQLEEKERELQGVLSSLEFAKNNAASERAAREQTERRLTARKAVNTRLRNRIKHGVCPCCRRTFENVARHMKTKHPQFNKDDGE